MWYICIVKVEWVIIVGYKYISVIIVKYSLYGLYYLDIYLEYIFSYYLYNICI